LAVYDDVHGQPQYHVGCGPAVRQPTDEPIHTSTVYGQRRTRPDREERLSATSLSSSVSPPSLRPNRRHRSGRSLETGRGCCAVQVYSRILTRSTPGNCDPRQIASRRERPLKGRERPLAVQNFFDLCNGVCAACCRAGRRSRLITRVKQCAPASFGGPCVTSTAAGPISRRSSRPNTGCALSDHAGRPLSAERCPHRPGDIGSGSICIRAVREARSFHKAVSRSGKAADSSLLASSPCHAIY
jgi:hypothetical protein